MSIVKLHNNSQVSLNLWYMLALTLLRTSSSDISPLSSCLDARPCSERAAVDAAGVGAGGAMFALALLLPIARPALDSARSIFLQFPLRFSGREGVGCVAINKLQPKDHHSWI